MGLRTMDMFKVMVAKTWFWALSIHMEEFLFGPLWLWIFGVFRLAARWTVYGSRCTSSTGSFKGNHWRRKDQFRLDPAPQPQH